MKQRKRLLLVILAIVTGILVFKTFLEQDNLVKTLKSLRYQVEIKDTTFRDHSSQKITATKDGKVLIAQIVKNVKKEKAGEITNGLNNPVEEVLQKVVITDPYSGRLRELSTPDSLKPTKVSLDTGSEPILYHIVYANEIFSLKIFSEAEAKYKGIYSSYYCPGSEAAYSLEIYSVNQHFNESESVELLKSLICN